MLFHAIQFHTYRGGELEGEEALAPRGVYVRRFPHSFNLGFIRSGFLRRCLGGGTPERYRM